MNKISYDERAEVYMNAIEKWGADMQLTIAVEEMAELAKEICKAKRGKTDSRHIAEEIADVTIMMEQLRLIFVINEEVCDEMDAKIRRLRLRLAERK